LLLLLFRIKMKPRAQENNPTTLEKRTGRQPRNTMKRTKKYLACIPSLEPNTHKKEHFLCFSPLG
jgi:hypothetical protein